MGTYVGPNHYTMFTDGLRYKCTHQVLRWQSKPYPLEMLRKIPRDEWRMAMTFRFGRTSPANTNVYNEAFGNQFDQQEELQRAEMQAEHNAAQLKLSNERNAVLTKRLAEEEKKAKVALQTTARQPGPADDTATANQLPGASASPASRIGFKVQGTWGNGDVVDLADGEYEHQPTELDNEEEETADAMLKSCHYQYVGTRVKMESHGFQRGWTVDSVHRKNAQQPSVSQSRAFRVKSLKERMFVPVDYVVVRVGMVTLQRMRGSKQATHLCWMAWLMWRNVDANGGGAWEDRLMPVEVTWLLGDTNYIPDLYDRPASAAETTAGDALWAAHLLTATGVTRPPHSTRRRFMTDRHAAVHMPIRSVGMAKSNQPPPGAGQQESPQTPPNPAANSFASPMFQRTSTQVVRTGDDEPDDAAANNSRPVMDDSNSIYNDLHTNATANLSTKMMLNALALQTEKTTREQADKLFEKEREKALKALEKEREERAEERRQTSLRERLQNDEYRSTHFPMHHCTWRTQTHYHARSTWSLHTFNGKHPLSGGR
jgi:hypothetical protein